MAGRIHDGAGQETETKGRDIMIVSKKRFEREVERRVREVTRTNRMDEKLWRQEEEIGKMRKKLCRAEEELRIQREELQVMKGLIADLQEPKEEEERAARIRGFYMGNGGTVYCTNETAETMAAGEDRTGQSVS